MVFGPDGNLYVASARNSNVLRYDGKTGAFLDQYVPTGTGGLDHALGITFGPDGRLYVASGGYDHNGRITALAGVLRFQGPSGPQPGAYIDTFVPPGTGGLAIPVGLLFGPDGNGDGRQDLYVNSQLFEGSFDATNNSSTILRFDGVTGAFIDTLVSADSGGLRGPGLMAFTETDPTTLAYLGSTMNLTADSLTLSDNRAVGGNANTGGPLAGDGRGGGLPIERTATVTGYTFTGNHAIGGAGAGGRNGADGLGGGIAKVLGFSVTVSGCTLSGNQAIGGAGGSGANGGTGFGGGIYNDGQPPLTIVTSTITGNQATGGAAGSGGSAGPGLGGGACFAAGGVACLDAATLADILGNIASTSSNNIFGASTIC
jgi:hypothetical protein